MEDPSVGAWIGDKIIWDLISHLCATPRRVEKSETQVRCCWEKVPGCWHFHFMKAEWLGWLHNPQNPWLGLSPVDALGFLPGRFSESSAGSLSPLGRGPCDQPDLA